MADSWERLRIRLKRLREKRGWTQEVLADRAGVARVTIARVETGNRRPSLGTLGKLAKALQVKVGDLLE